MSAPGGASKINREGDMLKISNNGPEIVSTNYWSSPAAKRGCVFLSVNSGCFQLLVPTGQVVLITRAPWPELGNRGALELLFEDYTGDPFVINIVSEQIDRIPLDSDRDRPGQPPRWQFAVYTEDGKIFACPARYRKAKRLPCLKRWPDDLK